MTIPIIALALFCIVVVNSETLVERCPQGRSPKELKQTIAIENCRKPPCRLKKRTSLKVEFRFTPGRNIEKLTNTVNAIIVGLPLPFIGVDNTNACNQLFQSDGITKAGCPLKAGNEYVYKTQLEIKEIYPNVKAVVHWGLTASDGQDVVCFRVPAKITN